MSPRSRQSALWFHKLRLTLAEWVIRTFVLWYNEGCRKRMFPVGQRGARLSERSACGPLLGCARLNPRSRLPTRASRFVAFLVDARQGKGGGQGPSLHAGLGTGFCSIGLGHEQGPPVA